MIKKEPYIGMPIILGEFDDITMSGQNVEIVPQKTEIPESDLQSQKLITAQSTEPALPDSVSSESETAMIPPVLQMPQQAPMPIRPEQRPMQNQQTPVPLPQPPAQQTMVVAMAYVPWQRWQQPFDYENAFEKGTIFPDLDLPFLGYQGGRR